MNITENIIYPIITNIASPIILFLIASQIMKFNRINKLISKIYLSVKNGLELNTDEEVPSSPNKKETAVKNKPTNNKQLSTNKLSLVDNLNGYTNVLKKISKNYGSDDQLGWKVRTFYTMFKEQLKENEIVSFKIREHSNVIVNLKTKDLIEKFDLNNPSENISDGTGKIRIYIFQDMDDKLYLVRFGKKSLNEPILLEK